MSGNGNFNPLEEIFSQAYFSIKFKEKYPHCADCKHVAQLIFSKNYYENRMKEKICSTCPKYKTGDENE